MKISRANLQPRAMYRTSTSVRLSSKVGVMASSANKRRKLLSVLVIVIVGRGEVTAGPHGKAVVELRLKTLCAFPVGRYMHPEARCIERKLGVTMVTVGHVRAAVSCCLEMAL